VGDDELAGRENINGSADGIDVHFPKTLSAMCGILFYFASEQIPDMPDDSPLCQRGPDAYNHVTLAPGVHAMFTRLAIVGTADGIQPLSLPKSRWHVLANGEIYNYKELAHYAGLDPSSFRSDIELLLHLATATEPINFASLNGDFAGILFDSQNKRCIAFREGVKPLYVGYSKTNTLVGFASLMSALKHVPNIARIEEFPPGHVLDEGGPKPFVTLKPTVRLNSEIVAKMGIFEHLTAAVRRRMLHSNVPVAFLCSGGIDSSILLCIGHQIWTQELGRLAADLQVFTLEYESSPDAFYAKILCQKLGVRHTVFKFNRTDIEENVLDILAVIETDDHRTLRAAVPQFMLAKQIATTPYKVILSGEGADELFMGYNYFYKCPTVEAAEAESERLLANMHRFDLLRADRCVSHWGLELRVPFLDPNVVEFVSALTGRNRSDEKGILRDAFAHIRVLRETRILERGKEKFSDGCGLGYVPALMRECAKQCGADSAASASASAHTLERFERQLCEREMRRAFGKIKTPKNADFRELPDWASVGQKVTNLLVG